MNNIYPPLAVRALMFLNAAKTLNKIQNRTIRSYEPAYYNLSHSVELSIKAVVKKETGKDPLWIHDKEELANKYKDECSFTDSEIEAIVKLKKLNNGPGGLRYDNEPIGQFLPSIFKDNVKIVERLLKKCM